MWTEMPHWPGVPDWPPMVAPWPKLIGRENQPADWSRRMSILNQRLAALAERGLPVTTETGPKSDLVRVPTVGAVLARAEVDLVGAFLSGRKATTLKAYDRDLADFAKYLGAADARAGMAALLGLEPGKANAVVLMYKSHMTERGLAAATVGRRLSAVKSCVKLARTLGLVVWSLDVEAPKAEPYRDTAGPGDRGWAQLLARATLDAGGRRPVALRDLAILRLLRALALRRSELVALDLGDVEWDPPRVWILGKGRSGKEPRTVPAAALAAVLDWVDVRGRWEGPLFTRLDRAVGAHCTERLTDKAVYLLVRRLGVRCGLSRRLAPHQLRHLAITQALDRSGGDVRAAQQFSRHADPRTLLRYDDNRQDLAGRLARLVDED